MMNSASDQKPGGALAGTEQRSEGAPRTTNRAANSRRFGIYRRSFLLTSVVGLGSLLVGQPATGEDHLVPKSRNGVDESGEHDGAADGSSAITGIGFEIPCALTADIAEYDRNIARVVATGATWVRMGWAYWDLSDYRDGKWIWNETNWQRAEDRIRRAREAGLKICLVSAAIRDVPWMSLADYIRMNRAYWRKTVSVAAKAGGVEVYQVYNEHNSRHFRTYAPVAKPPSARYLNDWASAIAAARQEAHAVLPDVLVTTCIGTNVNTRYWWQIYDVLADSCDVIGINAYPGTYVPSINALGGQIRRTEARYNKRVIITEIGLPLYEGGESSSVVEEHLPKMVEQAAKGEPLAVIVYSLRNSGTTETDPEQMFGVYTRDHKPRKTLAPLVRVIRSLR